PDDASIHRRKNRSVIMGRDSWEDTGDCPSQCRKRDNVVLVCHQAHVLDPATARLLRPQTGRITDRLLELVMVARSSVVTFTPTPCGTRLILSCGDQLPWRVQAMKNPELVAGLVMEQDDHNWRKAVLRHMTRLSALVNSLPSGRLQNSYRRRVSLEAEETVVQITEKKTRMGLATKLAMMLCSLGLLFLLCMLLYCIRRRYCQQWKTLTETVDHLTGTSSAASSNRDIGSEISTFQRSRNKNVKSSSYGDHSLSDNALAELLQSDKESSLPDLATKKTKRIQPKNRDNPENYDHFTSRIDSLPVSYAKHRTLVSREARSVPLDVGREMPVRTRKEKERKRQFDARGSSEEEGFKLRGTSEKPASKRRRLLASQKDGWDPRVTDEEAERPKRKRKKEIAVESDSEHVAKRGKKKRRMDQPALEDEGVPRNRRMSDGRTASAHVEGNAQDFANSLNNFYARFDQPDEHLNDVKKQLHESAEVDEDLLISTGRAGVFSRLKTGKASGPDNISPRLLRDCAAELADVFQRIFNLSVNSAAGGQYFAGSEPEEQKKKKKRKAKKDSADETYIDPEEQKV
ncbi:hypothetical protein BaRGS_00007967, partial [Batillaria attramentaria]